MVPDKFRPSNEPDLTRPDLGRLSHGGLANPAKHDPQCRSCGFGELGREPAPLAQAHDSGTIRPAAWG